MSEQIADIGTKDWMSQIRGAVARGWTHTLNANKVMDPDLAEAIVTEVTQLLLTDEQPRLGCATTRELFQELMARSEMNGTLDYRTIDED